MFNNALRLIQNLYILLSIQTNQPNKNQKEKGTEIHKRK